MSPHYVSKNGFKLKSLEVRRHPVLGTNHFDFLDENDQTDDIYFSVFIGPNGTGKSELFKLLISIFRGVFQNISEDKSNFRPNFLFSLKFYQNGYLLNFTNISEGVQFISLTGRKAPKYPETKFLLNDDLFPDTDVVTVLPVNIIANSIMLTDKFLVLRNQKEIEEFPIYRYLGVRNRPQQASSRSYVRKTIEFVVNQISSDTFRQGLLRLTNFLELPGKIEVSYNTANTKTFFTGKVSLQILDNFFQQIDDKYKKSEVTPPFKLNHYKSIKKQDETTLVKLVEYMNTLVLTNKLHHNPRSSIKTIKYDISKKLDHEFLQRDYKNLEHLRQLGILRPPELKLTNKNSLSIDQTSSGEFHFFSTMVGLMATVTPGSLVFIDEPEISLHPNWQMKYLSFVRELFSEPKFNTCHIIIATHSHFLISDLKGTSAKIIGLRKENNEIKTIDIFQNTYGWSAEQVLLDVFEVSTTRNYVVAERIGEMLDFISREESTANEIKQKYFELKLDKLVSLPEEDPLKTVLNTIIKEYVQ